MVYAFSSFSFTIIKTQSLSHFCLSSNVTARTITVMSYTT